MPRAASAVAGVKSIAIMPDVNTLKIGQIQQLSLVVELEPGVPSSGPPPLWSSMNPRVVAVDASGTATGVSVGETALHVSFRGKTATRQVHVVQ